MTPHCPRVAGGGLLVLLLAACSSSTPEARAPRPSPVEDVWIGAETPPPISAPEPEIPHGLRTARRIATETERRPPAPTLLARGEGPQLEALPLESLRVAGTLRSTRLRVLVECTFRNPYSRVLQGTFLIHLPEGASPCAAGMFLDNGPATFRRELGPDELLPPPLAPGTLTAPQLPLAAAWKHPAGATQWGTQRPARVIGSAQAQVAYERVVYKRPTPRRTPSIDPLLMEWSWGNSYRTRIYPVPALGRKRVYFAYDLAPELVGEQALASLPLPADLPEAFRLELTADAGRYPSATLHLGEREWTLPRRDDLLRIELAGEQLAGEGDCLLAARPQEAGLHAAFAQAEEVPGSLVHVRVQPSVPVGHLRATGDAVFLLDTSLNQRERLGASWGRLLRAILERDRSVERFQVVCFDVTARPLFPGWRANTAAERQRTFAELAQLWLQGATNLEAGLRCLDGSVPAPSQATFFLLSDAQLTWGQDDLRALEQRHPALMAARWIAYRVGQAPVNRAVLERLTRHGGRVVELVSAQDVETAALAHRDSGAVLQDVRVEGVPVRDLVVAGAPNALHPGQILEVAFRVLPGADPRAGELVIETPAGLERFALRGARGGDRLAARAWAELCTRQLLGTQRPEAERVAQALSQRFGLANRVASFLMLETDWDYQAHELEVAELDLNALAWLRDEAPHAEPRPELGSQGLSPQVQRLLAQLGGLRDRPWDRPSAPAPAGSRPRPSWPERLDPFVLFQEAAAHHAGGQPGEALRILSSLIEERPRDAMALRLVGFSLMGWGRWEDAGELFARTRRLRPFEPQTFICEALALEAQGRLDGAALRYEHVLGAAFETRPEQLELARQGARQLYGRLLARIHGLGLARERPSLARAVRERVQALGFLRAGAPGHERATHQLCVLWNLDETDVDLHVRESGPGGETISFKQRRSRSGGELLWDNTLGLGPELYVHPSRAPAAVIVDYFHARHVEGAIPAATLLVHHAGRGAKQRVVVRSAVLPERKARVALLGELPPPRG